MGLHALLPRQNSVDFISWTPLIFSVCLFLATGFSFQSTCLIFVFATKTEVNNKTQQRIHTLLYHQFAFSVDLFIFAIAKWPIRLLSHLIFPSNHVKCERPTKCLGFFALLVFGWISFIFFSFNSHSHSYAHPCSLYSSCMLLFEELIYHLLEIPHLWKISFGF